MGGMGDGQARTISNKCRFSPTSGWPPNLRVHERCWFSRQARVAISGPLALSPGKHIDQRSPLAHSS